MKTTFHLKPGRFTPRPEIEVDDERILCNDIHLPPHSFNPHNVKLWVIGNQFGACGAVWADCEQDAIDELIDSGLGDGILIDEADADDETARGGNAGEPYDTDYLWMAEVEFDGPRDWQLIAKFAEARGAQADKLSDV